MWQYCAHVSRVGNDEPLQNSISRTDTKLIVSPAVLLSPAEPKAKES